MPDLVTRAFLALREHFFDAGGRPIPFSLRPKHNTQDDPFDEMLATAVLVNLPGIVCERSSGPLITPDMVFYRRELCEGRTSGSLADAFDSIVGLEVKKLERTAQGTVARASGLDYNTTPPCGRVRVYDRAGAALDIRGFYLFVCLEPAGSTEVALTAMALVDGDLLNSDFDLYLSIVGERAKRIGLGTYGDGADRTRPMLIFANPLGISQLSQGASLVHPAADLGGAATGLCRVFAIERSLPAGGSRAFSCYRLASDVPRGFKLESLKDPFSTPGRRSVRTSPRGRFKLSFRLS
jgi:hypothetical protein